MQNYLRIPLIFFFIAASLGLLLRWHFISPLEFVQYPFLLHAHSHIMFLGWVFNAFYLAFVFHFARQKWASRYRVLFIVLQTIVVAMLISFPLQGYGLFSIVFSTLHIVTAIVFIVWFFKDLKQVNLKNSISARFVKISLVFFLLSALGPFTVGYIAADGHGQSNGYYFAVYYYLHFQYNGFFLFGVLGLFFRLLEERNFPFSQAKAQLAGYIMAGACLPAYFLSVLWANPGWVFYTLGFIAAVLQIISLILFIRLFHRNPGPFKATFKPFSLFILILILCSLILKIGLQLISVHPQVSRLAYEVRSYIIAYLHLVLLGIITLFLLIWYVEQGFIGARHYRSAFVLFIFGFAGMELLLIGGPSWSTMMRESGSMVLQKGIFIFSLFLGVSSGWFVFSPLTYKTDD